MRRGSLVFLAICTALAGSLACGDPLQPDGQNGRPPKTPARPPYVAGNYTLRLVDGHPLPFVLDTLEDCAGEGGVGVGTEWISAGGIEFAVDSSFDFWHVVSTVCWPLKGWNSVSSDGTYSVRSTGAIVLTTTSSNKPGSVRYTTSGNVELLWRSRTQLYEKESATLTQAR